VFHREEDQADPGPGSLLDAAGSEIATAETAGSEAAEDLAAAELLDRTAAEDWGLLLPSAQAVHERSRNRRRNRRTRGGLLIAAAAGIAAAVMPPAALSRTATTAAGRHGAATDVVPTGLTGAPTSPGTGARSPFPSSRITDPAMIEAFQHGTAVGSGTVGDHSWLVRVVVYDDTGAIPAVIKQQFFYGGAHVSKTNPVALVGEYEAGALTGVRMSPTPDPYASRLDFANAADMTWADDGSDAVFVFPVGTNVTSVLVSSPTAQWTFPAVEAQGYRFVAVVLAVTSDEQVSALDARGTVVAQQALTARPPL
jgi:hypothetical protein